MRTLVGDGRLQADQVSVSTVRRLLREHGLRRTSREVPTRDHRRWQVEQPGHLWHADVCHGPTLRVGGAVLTVESGSTDEPWPHVRFRCDTVHLWRLEMPARNQCWEKTGFRAGLDELVDMVASDFPWMLKDWSTTAERTSDLGH